MDRFTRWVLRHFGYIWGEESYKARLESQQAQALHAARVVSNTELRAFALLVNSLERIDQDARDAIQRNPRAGHHIAATLELRMNQMVRRINEEMEFTRQESSKSKMMDDSPDGPETFDRESVDPASQSSSEKFA